MSEQFSLFDGPKNSTPTVLVFDLETLRSADEVGGWSNIKDMGMACGVLYDSSDDQYHVYEEKEVQDLIAHFQKADLIVGFNHIRFDYEVLRGYSEANFSKLPSFDMLVEVKNLLGHRLKLNSLVAATLGDAKSADGLQSLRWVKEGRFDLIREYCKKDVEVTKRLFDHGVEKGFVAYENYGQPVQLKVDWNIDSLVKRYKK